MPPRRKQPADTAASSKRFRSAIDDSLAEFLCPITYELPLEPVLAEDGKVYERSAIETWLKDKPRSPTTNVPMGTKLTPATQIKNMIERMVKSDALPEDKVAAWKERIAKQEEVAEVRRAAEGGDAEAAYKLGKWFENATMGLGKDEAKAFVLYEQAAKAGHPRATGKLANFYNRGIGTMSSEPLALRWAAAGVALGCGIAMTVLGNLYANGRAGLRQDHEEGLRLRVAAAERGCLNTKGLFRLGLMFANGDGTPVDMDKAAEWMRKAVLNNWPPESAQQARDWLTARQLEVDLD